MLTKAPEGLAYTNDYIQKALQLKARRVDVNGADFKPVTVTLNPAAHRGRRPGLRRCASPPCPFWHR